MPNVGVGMQELGLVFGLMGGYVFFFFLLPPGQGEAEFGVHSMPATVPDCTPGGSNHIVLGFSF